MAEQLKREEEKPEAIPDTQEKKKYTMKVVCAWCGKDLGAKESTKEQEGRTSHGICEECKKKFLTEAED